MKHILSFALGALMALSAHAEDRTYGDIYLSGLARDSWPHNPEGEWYAMVCNVNGPDGYLSVRSGPGTKHEVLRNLERLAIVTVDTGQRQGHWVRVVGAHRDHSPDGDALADRRHLPVAGWAHDNYLCDFLD